LDLRRSAQGNGWVAGHTREIPEDGSTNLLLTVATGLRLLRFDFQSRFNAGMHLFVQRHKRAPLEIAVLSEYPGLVIFLE
jgi:hypothetical protein